MTTTQDPFIHFGSDDLPRCWWTKSAPELVPYHDDEWGYPVSDDVRLFEKMSLESFQSGLSWLTILKKRPAFRNAFAGFDFGRVARFGARDVERLLGDAGIVRHRGKIEATIHNASVVREIADRYGSLASFVWRFEPDAAERPQRVYWEEVSKLSKTPTSTAMSRALKKHGWKFFGPTTAYAFMQAMGLVNDHQEECHCRERAERARADFDRPD
jgi:DNA-3-methyladenine glycosylase I